MAAQFGNVDWRLPLVPDPNSSIDNDQLANAGYLEERYIDKVKKKFLVIYGVTVAEDGVVTQQPTGIEIAVSDDASKRFALRFDKQGNFTQVPEETEYLFAPVKSNSKGNRATSTKRDYEGFYVYVPKPARVDNGEDNKKKDNAQNAQNTKAYRKFLYRMSKYDFDAYLEYVDALDDWTEALWGVVMKNAEGKVTYTYKDNTKRDKSGSGPKVVKVDRRTITSWRSIVKSYREGLARAFAQSTAKTKRIKRDPVGRTKYITNQQAKTALVRIARVVDGARGTHIGDDIQADLMTSAEIIQIVGAYARVANPVVKSAQIKPNGQPVTPEERESGVRGAISFQADDNLAQLLSALGTQTARGQWVGWYSIKAAFKNQLADKQVNEDQYNRIAQDLEALAAFKATKPKAVKKKKTKKAKATI